MNCVCGHPHKGTECYCGCTLFETPEEADDTKGQHYGHCGNSMACFFPDPGPYPFDHIGNHAKG